MDEKKEEKQPTEDTGEGDKPQTPSLIAEANAAAERLEAANKRQEELQAEQKEIIARQTLGGRTHAGQPMEKPAELTAEEYAQQVRDGKINPLKTNDNKGESP